MKFLTWVSLQCVLSVIPNVTYFKLKCIVVLCLYINVVSFVQNVVHGYIPKLFIVSISIVQNKVVSLIESVDL